MCEIGVIKEGKEENKEKGKMKGRIEEEDQWEREKVGCQRRAEGEKFLIRTTTVSRDHK